MNQKHLLRFIKKMMKQSSHDVVCKNADGRDQTLAEVRLRLFVTVSHRPGKSGKAECPVKVTGFS